MADTYGERTPLSPDAPAIGAKAIDYSSDQDLSDRRVRFVLLSTGGTLKVDFVDQAGPAGGIVLAGLVAGTQYRLSISKIYNSGSTGAVGVVLY